MSLLAGIRDRVGLVTDLRRTCFEWLSLNGWFEKTSGELPYLRVFGTTEGEDDAMVDLLCEPTHGTESLGFLGATAVLVWPESPLLAQRRGERVKAREARHKGALIRLRLIAFIDYWLCNHDGPMAGIADAALESGYEPLERVRIVREVDLRRTQKSRDEIALIKVEEADSNGYDVAYHWHDIVMNQPYTPECNIASKIAERLPISLRTIRRHIKKLGLKK